MTYLVRMISRGKWPDSDYNIITIDKLSADAVTDLKTSKNTLSTWEINSKEELEYVALALAANRNKIEKIDIVSIEKAQIVNSGFEIGNNPGNTPVTDIADTHKDIINLTHKSLGEFATIVLKSLEDRHIFYSKKDVTQIFIKAIKEGRLDINKVNKDLRNELNLLDVAV